MPWGWGFWGSQPEKTKRPVTGRPRRDRSKNKAQKRARKVKR